MPSERRLDRDRAGRRWRRSAGPCRSAAAAPPARPAPPPARHCRRPAPAPPAPAASRHPGRGRARARAAHSVSVLASPVGPGRSTGPKSVAAAAAIAAAPLPRKCLRRIAMRSGRVDQPPSAGSGRLSASSVAVTLRPSAQLRARLGRACGSGADSAGRRPWGRCPTAPRRRTAASRRRRRSGCG